jgi:hypothetical protein
MSDPDFDAIDPESLQELCEPTVEIPAVLLLAACGCSCEWGGPNRGAPGRRCC